MFYRLPTELPHRGLKGVEMANLHLFGNYKMHEWYQAANVRVNFNIFNGLVVFISKLIRQLEVQTVTLWATIFTEFLPIYRKNASAFAEKIFFVKPLTDGGPTFI